LDYITVNIVGEQQHLSLISCKKRALGAANVLYKVRTMLGFSSVTF